MNNQSVTLLSILYRCNPQDEDLSRESKLQTILHSAEYREVSKREVFAEQFHELFAAEKLRTYSPKQLANVTKVLPLIPTALEDIVYSLQNGAAPTLTRGDAPDFRFPRRWSVFAHCAGNIEARHRLWRTTLDVFHHAGLRHRSCRPNCLWAGP